MFFVRLCSSSSLLLDGVLPFDNERTAGGAIVTKRRNVFFSSTQAVAYVSAKEGSGVAFIILKNVRKHKTNDGSEG